MEILIAAIVVGLLPAGIAWHKGRSFALWWLYGTALWIVALPHALCLRATRMRPGGRALIDGIGWLEPDTVD